MFPLDLVPKAYLAENGDQFIELYKMASGFGFNGHEGRCYRFWKEVEECNKNSDYLGQCTLQAEDYIECLHHKKELTRMNAIVLEKKRQEGKKRNEEQTHGAGH